MAQPNPLHIAPAASTGPHQSDGTDRDKAVNLFCTLIAVACAMPFVAALVSGAAQ